MTLTVEVDDTAEEQLSELATAAGKSTSEYAGTALLQHLDRVRQLNDAIREIQQGSGSLGRDGRPWRELTHEGHKY